MTGGSGRRQQGRRRNRAGREAEQAPEALGKPAQKAEGKTNLPTPVTSRETGVMALRFKQTPMHNILHSPHEKTQDVLFTQFGIKAFKDLNKMDKSVNLAT